MSKWQKFYTLQCGRKLSQRAVRIYCHYKALKCRKVAKLSMLQCDRKLSQSAKLYMLQCGEKLSQLAVRIYCMRHL